MSILNTGNQPPIDSNGEGVGGDDIHHYQFEVKMPCEDCKKSIDQALKKIPEVVKVEIDIPTQIVEVWTTLAYLVVLEAIKKTGKEVVEGKELPVLPGDLTD